MFLLTPELAVITPSYAPDLELCRDLHQSVLDFTTPSTVHYLIVPAADVAQFESMRGPRCVVWSERELLPPRMVSLAWANPMLHRLRLLGPSTRLAAVNARRPFPPVRGWVLQQILKLEAATRVDARVAVLLDSDVQFIRPVAADTFSREGRVGLYRRAAAVDDSLPSHVTWHRVARRLLGLADGTPPYPDYVSSFTAWDPGVVRSLQNRIQTVTGRPWMDAVGAELHFSEWTLYGVYVDNLLAAEADVIDASLCHSYWDPVPLDRQGALDFIGTVGRDDVAAMISAKSRTPLAVRRYAMTELVARCRTEE